MPNIQTAPQRTHVLQVLGNAIVGGMETYVTRLIERLPPDQFTVTALCPHDNQLADQIRALGADVYVTPMPDNPPWSSIQMTSALVKALAVDVLHAHLPNAHLLAGLAGKLSGKPVVTTIHGRQLSTLDLEVHRAASTHLSPVCQQTYFHALGLGVNPAQLHMIPNGVDTRQFMPPASKPSTLRQKWGVPVDAPLIGFVGRLSPEKGPDVFIRVALAVRAHAPETHFVVVGDGPMRKDLQQTIQRLELSDCVHMAGLVHDMPAVYQELDIVVSTSRSEAMPLALMEAMSSGLPLVATRVGGVPDLVQHGLTGWLAGDGDFEALATHALYLVQHPEERHLIGRRGRERALSRFSMDQTLSATAALLHKLALRTPEPRRVSAVINGSKPVLNSVSNEAGKAASG
ncbi:MAG: glycosyltransferase [Acidobacteriota bacterium]